jgi:AcrR family transcriptional regulator
MVAIESQEPSMPKGIPLTEEEQARRRAEIFIAAAQLFLKKGFTETSMREIGEAAGMGKSTLYDYYRTKDEILVSYFVEELHTITRRAEDIRRMALPAAEKLRRILYAQLEYILDNKDVYVPLAVEVQRLSAQSQKDIHSHRHAYQDMICRLIESGIEEGSFRPVDSLLATRIIIATITPVAFTSRPTGSPQKMLDSALDILLNGIRA